MQRFRVVYHGILHEPLGEYAYQDKRQEGYSMVYHERALYNYFIACHRKYSGCRNQCDIRAARDGRVRSNTSK